MEMEDGQRQEMRMRAVVGGGEVTRRRGSTAVAMFVASARAAAPSAPARGPDITRRCTATVRRPNLFVVVHAPQKRHSRMFRYCG